MPIQKDAPGTMLHQTKPSLISPPHRVSGCDQSSPASVRGVLSHELCYAQVTTHAFARWIASNSSLHGKTKAEARE